MGGWLGDCAVPLSARLMRPLSGIPDSMGRGRVLALAVVLAVLQAPLAVGEDEMDPD